MLIIYRLSDGAVLDNSGTNSAAPLGLPADDAEAWALNVEATGVPFADVGFLRLHDVDDAETVALTFTDLCHVENGQVVSDGPLPGPEPLEPQPTTDDRVAELETALAAKDEQIASLADGQAALLDLVFPLLMGGL